MGAFEVVAVRKQFPALDEGAAHFDGPGGSQTPQVVADAVARTMTSALANRGQLTAAERRADEIVVGGPRGDGRPARHSRRTGSSSAAA